MSSLLRAEEEIDVTRYLPSFLKKDPHFKAVCDACSLEHEYIRNTILDILNQFFVEKATWGLETWERVLDLPTDLTLAVQQRRNAIIIKLQQPESVTELFLTKLVNRFISDSSGIVLSYPEEYRIEILYNGGTVFDYKNLRNSIELYIPAHLGYKLITYTTGILHFHGAGTVQSYQKISVDMTTVSSQQVDDTNFHIAGEVIHNYKSFSISGGTKPWLNFHP